MRGEPTDLPNLVVDACHDLRTPLAAAFGFARTIERMGGVTGDNAMYLQQVIEATQELEQLIAALSAVAHGERGTLRLRPQPVDLGELVLEAAEGSGHALESVAVAGMVDRARARPWRRSPRPLRPSRRHPRSGATERWRVRLPDPVTVERLAGVRRALRATAALAGVLRCSAARFGRGRLRASLPLVAT